MTAAELSDADYLSLNRLVTELFWRIDHENETIAELYTEDAVIEEGPPLDKRWVGRDQVVEWSNNRPQWAQHVITNMRWAADGPDGATGNCTLTAYVDDEDHQFRGTTVPRAVAGIEFRCVRTAEGWRFSWARGNFRFIHAGSHESG